MGADGKVDLKTVDRVFEYKTAVEASIKDNKLHVTFTPAKAHSEALGHYHSWITYSYAGIKSTAAAGDAVDKKPDA